LLLVEKGGEISKDHEIKAENSFSFVGTMNPGGDYGKKELSPALRNRMTEIWAGVTDDLMKDYTLIATHNLQSISNPESIATFMVDFITWFKVLRPFYACQGRTWGPILNLYFIAEMEQSFLNPLSTRMRRTAKIGPLAEMA